MGSWDVVCNLTGVNIGVGDSAVIIPLVIKDKLYDNALSEMRLYGKTNILSNMTVNTYFQEACYPIFGTYDDYGNISDVKEDSNTKTLEEYFGLDINKIIQVLTDNRKDEILTNGKYCDSSSILDISNPRHVELCSYSITWIHGDIYEKLSKIKSEEYIDFGNRKLLEELGFIYEGVDDSKKRYNLKFTKDGTSIYSDGTWIGFNTCYTIKQLEKFFLSKEIKVNLNNLKSKGYWEQVYDYKLLPKLKGHILNLELQSELLLSKLKGKDNSEELSRGKNLYDLGHLCNDLLLYRDYTIDKKPKVNKLRKSFMNYVETRPDWDKIPKETIKKINKLLNELESATIGIQLSDLYVNKIKENQNEFLRKNIQDWFKVKQYYFTSGRFLFPIGTSPQWGDEKSLQNLIDVASEVNNQQIAELEEIEEEE